MKFYNEEFKKIRKSKKLSIKDIADMTGNNWKTIWNWESQKIIPTEAKIRHLCNCLKIECSLISDIESDLECSESSLKEIAASWLSFISADITKNLKIESNIIDSVKELSERLQKTTVLLNTFLSYSNALLYIKDTNQTYVVANNLFKKNLGLAENFNVLGKIDEDFFSINDSKRNKEEDTKVISTGIPIKNREDYIPGSRKVKWGLISKIPIFDSDNKIAGVIGSFVDVTDRKKNEEIQYLLTQAFDESQDCIFLENITKKDDLSLLGAFQSLYGYPKKMFYDKNFISENCIHPEEKELEQKYISNPNSCPKYRTFRIITSTNEVKYVEETIQIAETYKLKIQRDITKKKKEEELREILEINIAAMSDGISITASVENGKWEYLYVNKALENIIGYGIEELSEYDPLQFWLEKIIYDDFYEVYKSFLDLNTQNDKIEVKVKSADGSLKWLEITKSLGIFKNQDCIISVVRDITNKKIAESSRVLLEMCIDSISDGMYIQDLETLEYVYINDAAANITGYSKEKFMKLGSLNFWKDGITFAGNAIHEQNPKELKSTYEIIRADGEERLIKSSAILKEYSNKQYAFVLTRDITDESE